jgi:hypothetical protein
MKINCPNGDLNCKVTISGGECEKLNDSNCNDEIEITIEVKGHRYTKSIVASWELLEAYYIESFKRAVFDDCKREK